MILSRRTKCREWDLILVNPIAANTVGSMGMDIAKSALTVRNAQKDKWQKARNIVGTIRNEMTIVHCFNKDKLENVREDAIKFFNEFAHINVADSMIGPIMQSYINEEYTFVINGDCSKIGWETSEQFHEARMKWCEKHKYDVQNIIVINFGEDYPCYIVFDSNTELVHD